jgi:hypothetical protein
MSCHELLHRDTHVRIVEPQESHHRPSHRRCNVPITTACRYQSAPQMGAEVAHCLQLLPRFWTGARLVACRPSLPSFYTGARLVACPVAPPALRVVPARPLHPILADATRYFVETAADPPPADLIQICPASLSICQNTCFCQHLASSIAACEQVFKVYVKTAQSRCAGA